ncbi:aspartyl/asparaginyl beta-hydroxylase domain-containing protein [Pseudoalteromonas umbrosa]|uniref:aspartyl/asparaginyl beta-hydroxylase domain-containing protein n=1 Tax=Pseudoalteromonas umbrosa TaxID=3048489 RepID=UPI0024C2BB3D|nr:aspartyl/asparaginyl beta-hydroxylase domain-containing protein [Pseudoalteromonas sp. B95]MDK1288476.1 aspartyl/asparaginyl beta-hydroxylase domain-containing protein [Pseudoalteromonas sp. B95]
MTLSCAQPTKVLAGAKLDLSCCVNALLDDVISVSNSHWCRHVNTSCFTGEWDVLALYADQAHLDAHPILQCFSIEECNGQFSPLPIMGSLHEIERFLSQFKCPFKSVRLMRLGAGSQIYPHQDHRLSLEYGEARIHIPITGSEEIEFVVGGQKVPMRNGEAWYVNADLEHSVLNRGFKARVNLVIDCKVNAWLKNIIECSEQKF